MGRLHPFTAQELNERLRRPGEQAQAAAAAAARRRVLGVQSAAVFAAMAAAASGGGGGGGGSHTGGLIDGDSAVVEGEYPYWSDDFEDGLLTGWDARLGTWAEDSGLLKLVTTSGVATYRGLIVYEDAGQIDDIECFATLSAASVTNGIIAARLEDLAVPSGYGVRVAAAAVEIRLLQSTTSTLLGTVAMVLGTGDQVGIRCHGDQIAAVVNGLTVLQVTDATHAAGFMGFVGQSTAKPWFDDWGTR